MALRLANIQELPLFIAIENHDYFRQELRINF